jgi:adenylosuccinate lyase
MTTRITDSALYQHLWGTAESRAVLGEKGRLEGWLEVIVALARAQAAAGVIPASAAALIAEHARADRIDLGYAAEQTRQTSHSTLGLIRALKVALPEHAREYVYAGATVQDITDTWTALALRRIGGIVWRDLRRIEEQLLDLAVAHRSTVMAGRTHGQTGSPVTFGWKAASWADEIRRHLDRIRAGAPRWLVGQLGGGTGSLVFYGPQGLAVRARFCAELGLADPGISWPAARDRGAEFAQLLALIGGTLARIGGEVYELQRPEIGELAETSPAGTVGSITMPHKRNPEASEHLDTLARLVRASAAVMVEAVAQQHERDGRGWKAEWVALPEACLLATAALQIAIGLLDGLHVDAGAMRRNLARHGGYPLSERALALLVSGPGLGPRQAQERLQDALASGATAGLTAEQALVSAGLLGPEQAQDLTARPDTGSCQAMTDLVVERARKARAVEPGEWP